jgi:hypothetical protein
VEKGGIPENFTTGAGKEGRESGTALFVRLLLTEVSPDGVVVVRLG